MPIIVMQIMSAAPHPNADALRIYTFEAPGHGSVQVVANHDHIYEVGDCAAVALVGTTMLNARAHYFANLCES